MAPDLSKVHLSLQMDGAGTTHSVRFTFFHDACHGLAELALGKTAPWVNLYFVLSPFPPQSAVLLQAKAGGQGRGTNSGGEAVAWCTR